MRNITSWVLAVTLVATIALSAWFFATYKAVSIPRAQPADSLSDFSLPAGFSISVFADNVPDARVMAFDPRGALLVSQPSEGVVSALLDRDGDGVSERARIVVEGLNHPHGLALRCPDPSAPDICQLYVAQENALDVFDYDANTGLATDRTRLLELPDGGVGTHVTRSLLFMPSPRENTLLVSVGSSCNVCDEVDARRAKVIAYDVVTGSTTEFARGLRNSVFMGIHPVTGDIWATEMGRDGLGDEIPPDEVNILTSGGNYGWPVCYGKNIHDADYDKNTYIRNPCMDPFETPSHLDIPAHSAPLGLAFIPEEGWPEEWWHHLLVAYHGSWNRSEPTGYKIVRASLDDRGNPTGGFEDFITGWLRPDGTKIGRPADVKALPGGVVYISDDGAGRIYRVSR